MELGRPVENVLADGLARIHLGLGQLLPFPVQVKPAVHPVAGLPMGVPEQHWRKAVGAIVPHIIAVVGVLRLGLREGLVIAIGEHQAEFALNGQKSRADAGEHILGGDGGGVHVHQTQHVAASPLDQHRVDDGSCLPLTHKSGTVGEKQGEAGFPASSPIGGPGGNGIQPTVVPIAAPPGIAGGKQVAAFQGNQRGNPKGSTAAGALLKGLVGTFR